MLEYRSELTTEEDRKLHKLFSFLLEKIYKLDPTAFKFVGSQLGLLEAGGQSSASANPDDDLTLPSKNAQMSMDSEAKKKQAKKKQSKLMKKMKGKA